MLQDLHTPSLTHADADNPSSASVSRSPNAHPFSANTYAERLMDELFEDVEQLLDLDAPAMGAENPPTDPELDHVAQPFPATEVRENLAPGMPLATRSAAIALDHAQGLPEQSLAAVTTDPLATPIPISSPTIAPQRAWERFLLAVGCVSVVVTLGLWLLYQDSQHQKMAEVTTMGAATTASVADQKFANYLQKSLQHIDQQPQSTSGISSQPTGGVKVPGMPNVLVPPTSGPAPLASNATGTGTERVYVPVYQLPTNLYPPGSKVAPLPNLHKAGQSPSIPAAGFPQATTSAPAGVVRRLVGVLEQGNGSVALFEINGVTQRYELGESIGSSGWTLVEVSKNQAIIRRNGDVRSLFVGHSF
jgi:hypothetical protein